MVDILLLGAPGAGKGTQAELLRQWLPLPQVSSGDLFRANLSANTELGLKARSYMDRGELVPDDVTIAMVAERIGQPDCAQGVILDGFPRTVAQAEALGKLLASMGRRVDVVVYFAVSKETLIKRLGGRWTCRQCGKVYHELYSPERVKGVCDVCGGALYQRADDTPETQRRRIEVYLNQTAPLQAYYIEQGLLVEVDGEQEIEPVQAALKRAIQAVR
ncbi:MAG: adenylate kinase [Chloroflexota bacterium]